MLSAHHTCAVNIMHTLSSFGCNQEPQCAFTLEFEKDSLLSKRRTHIHTTGPQLQYINMPISKKLVLHVFVQVG